MDDVVNLVAERLALPLDEAQIAVTLVPEQLKSKAAAITGPIDSLLAGGNTPGLANLVGGLGSMFKK